MGGGYHKDSDYASYSRSVGRGVSKDSLGRSYINTSKENKQTFFKARTMDASLNPYQAIRECCDSEEHPFTKPVILALDVTGSMGEASVECMAKLNIVIRRVIEDLGIKDVEFMTMGIGDMYYDEFPLQVTQFESDIRITEQMDSIFHEHGGGGNSFESYTLAWYFAINHCKLDCWKRGKKGLIITMGDELINPYIPKKGHHNSIENCLGDIVQADIETKDILEETLEKYDVYHIDVDHSYRVRDDEISLRSLKNQKSFAEYLGQRSMISTVDKLADTIVEIIKDAFAEEEAAASEGKSNSNKLNSNGEITW